MKLKCPIQDKANEALVQLAALLPSLKGLAAQGTAQTPGVLANQDAITNSLISLLNKVITYPTISILHIYLGLGWAKKTTTKVECISSTLAMKHSNVLLHGD